MPRLFFAAALLAAIVLPSTAHAAGVSYYRIDKAGSDCAEGKKNAAAQKADFDAKQKQVEEASAKKAPDADKLGNRLLQEFKGRVQEDAGKLQARIERIVPIIRKAHRLDALLPVGAAADVDPRVDLTAEVVKALDDGKGKLSPEEAEEVSKHFDALAARVKELEAAAAKAPVAPAVAPPPAKVAAKP